MVSSRRMIFRRCEEVREEFFGIAVSLLISCPTVADAPRALSRGGGILGIGKRGSLRLLAIFGWFMVISGIFEAI